VACFFDPLHLVGCSLVGVAFGGVGGLLVSPCNAVWLVAWSGCPCLLFEGGEGGLLL